MLVDQDYEDFIAENFLDEDGNYHLKDKMDNVMTSTMLDEQQLLMSSSSAHKHNVNDVNNIPEISSTMVNSVNSDVTSQVNDYDNNILKMNEQFVDNLTTNEIGIDDITGQVLDVLLSGMGLISKIKIGLNGETGPSSSKSKNIHNMENNVNIKENSKHIETKVPEDTG